MHLHAQNSRWSPIKLLLIAGGILVGIFPAASEGASVAYRYDVAGRLVQASFTNGAAVTYSYDKIGNRLSFESSYSLSGATWEDAEDGDILGWDIYDKDPEGATIAIVEDETLHSNVIELSGSGTSNGYRLRNADGSNFNDTTHTIMQWSQQYSEPFTVYIAVQTIQGFRYIYYTPVVTSQLGTSTYIHHGLGTAARDGSWHTYIRDLEYDLQEAQPENELLSVLAFLIRGSGRVDNIGVRETIPATLDSDGDSIRDLDELTNYLTNPYSADSDGDGIDDGDELAYWGTAWNQDIDGDGFINLLDPDSDNDGNNDGRELITGSDPADGGSVPSIVVFEDAEDGLISGWDVYDSDPAGAYVDNVYDDARASRVISVNGSTTSNGYRLRNDDLTVWNETDFTILQWSLAYSENFTVYVLVQTAEGSRYLTYTPVDYDNLGAATYVHHGLGSYVKSGEWFTFIRDLQYDLQEAQPTNTITAINAILIRGTGRIDDIAALKAIPESQDSDGDGITDLEEINTYGTHPYIADSDGDDIDDGSEATYWGTSWNEDSDTDGVVNLLDDDSDGDGFRDGLELDNATDPADAASYPTALLYEDAEDGRTNGWDIYDDDPAGALIENVFDESRGSNVISFTGTGTSNGFRLRTPGTSAWWYDDVFTKIRWSMKFNSPFTVYIAAQTKDGFRYIYYTPVDTDNLGDGTYVHHGLGASAIDGVWHTFTRDLENDLKDAQPDNELEYIQGFLIRGTGQVDDIMTVE